MSIDSRQVISEKHHAPESTAQKIIVRLRQPSYKAIILHPSLGCPLILDNKDKVSLLLAGDASFATTFKNGAGGSQIGGDNIKLVIAQCLKLLPWQQATVIQKKPNKAPALYNANREQAFANITCTLLGDVERAVKNANGSHFANIRPATQNILQEMGLTHLFQVDLNNLPELAEVHKRTLYDIFWVGLNSKERPVDLDKVYLDPQDRLLRQKVMGSFYKYANDGQGDIAKAPAYAYRVDRITGVVFEPDTATPLMTRHPICVMPAGKDALNLGHLSDIHVSSKQHAYKDKGATVIPGADPLVSPLIGKLANNNAENLFDLLG